MKKEKNIIHGVHHTHWDLEWYFTDTESMILLIYSLDEVFGALESGDIEYYTLDGQMSILDKYFEIMPEKKDLVKKLVQENKLIIGPWYTQVDEFLTSGESFIRNLELGIEQSEALGNTMEVGYMPDSFGHSKDLPKILNGFDIDTFVFWRGFYNPKSKREFYWESEDGSNVLSSNIKNGYFEGRDLFEKENTANVKDILVKNLNESKGANSLLPVGWDQRPVYNNLKRVMSDINEVSDNYELIESTYEKYFEQLKNESLNLPTYNGEFMYANVSKIHRSIYSSRYDLKQLNDYLERNLVFVLEPLMLMADQLGIPYKKEILNQIWKFVTINQAHDSLGGCNSDKTNRNILARGTRAKEYLDSTIDYLIRKITISTESLENNNILIANTLNYNNEKLKEITVYSRSKNFIIKDSDGNVLKFDVINQTQLDKADTTRFDVELKDEDIYYETKILIEYPMIAFSIAVLSLEEADNTSQIYAGIKQEAHRIENEYYSIEFNEGRLDLTLKNKQKTINNFIQFVNDGDEGDSYDYSPAYDDLEIWLNFENSNINSNVRQLSETIELTGSWKLPKDLSERESEIFTTFVPYRMKIGLNKGQKTIDFNVEIENTVKDHRIRSVIKSNVVSDTSNAGTQFGYTIRDNEDKYLHKWKELNWREEPTSLYPLLNYVNIHDENEGMTLFSRGPKEYQILENATNSIALTLYRSVGYLGRPDLIRRPGHASGIRTKYIETPDAQLLQNLNFEFSVIYEETFDSSIAYKNYQLYATDLPYYQLQDLENLSSTMSFFMINKKDNLADYNETAFNLPSMSETRLIVSSISKQNDSVQLRLFNPYLKGVLKNQKLAFTTELDYEIVNLRGQAITSRTKTKEIVFEEVKPGQIITIRIYES